MIQKLQYPELKFFRGTTSATRTLNYGPGVYKINHFNPSNTFSSNVRIFQLTAGGAASTEVYSFEVSAGASVNDRNGFVEIGSEFGISIQGVSTVPTNINVIAELAKP